MTVKTLTDAEKVKRFDTARAKEKRYWVKQTLTLRKAVGAGIKVTEEEIDAYIKSK